MKKPICVRDLQGTHLINNLAPSSSPTVCHILAIAVFPRHISQVWTVQNDLWRESVGVTSCFSQHANTLPSHNVTMMVCSTVNKNKSDLSFSAPVKILLCLGSKQKLSFPSSSSSLVWMRAAGQSSRPLTRRARCRASRRFLPHFSWLVTILSQRSLLASPKCSNLNKTVIQFRVFFLV